MAKEKLRKEIKVSFSPEFDEEYRKLLKEVVEDRERGIENSFNIQLLKAIDRTISLLKIQSDYGIHIPKNRIPREFTEKYGINNLWKVDLPSSWRLCYTLKTSRIEILTILLEFINHKRYNKLFGYKKK
ncbi:MAG: hypothetical protein ABIE23_02980 [archaeon]